MADLGKTYYVMGRDGRLYGPADMATLAGWAQTRRLKADSILKDSNSGETCRADSIPELFTALNSPNPHAGCMSTLLAMPLALVLGLLLLSRLAR